MGRTHATQTRAKTPACQYAVGPADTFNRTLTTMGKPINSTTATQCFACGWIFIDGSFLVEPEAVPGESRIYTFASSFQVWMRSPLPQMIVSPARLLIASLLVYCYMLYIVYSNIFVK